MTPEKVTCPCCHGTGKLVVYDENFQQDLTVYCCHCMGKRYVMAEAERIMTGDSDGEPTVPVQR